MIPADATQARALLNGAPADVSILDHGAFVRLWNAVAFLYPGLHPDGFDDEGSGWPAALRPIVADMWRRYESGELTDPEAYPCDAQRAGIEAELAAFHS